MLTVLTAAIIVFFVGMGLVGLLTPDRIPAMFGTERVTLEGRNEVRAVYGGFGIAVAAVLVAAMWSPSLRPGVAVAVSAALFGMAGGRVVSALFERPTSFYPLWFFCVAEAAMGLVLWAWW